MPKSSKKLCRSVYDQNILANLLSSGKVTGRGTGVSVSLQNRGYSPVECNSRGIFLNIKQLSQNKDYD